MFYKKAVAFSVAAAMLLSAGCSSSDTDNVEIKFPQESADTNSDANNINDSNIEEPPAENEKIDIKIGSYNSASALGIAHLLENSETDVAYEKYIYTNYNNAEEVVNALKNKEINAAALPLNEAVKLYNSTENEFKIATINSLFNYCIVGNSGNISDLTAIAGKSIAVADNDEVGKIVINKLIKDYNIQGCSITTVENTQSLIESLANGSVQLALSQEPYASEVTAKNPNVSMMLDLYDSWFEKENADIVTGCLVVSNDFIQNNKKALTYFLKDYNASVILTKKNIDESSQLAKKHKLSSSAEIAKSAIPGCTISSKSGEEMVDTANKCINLLNSIDPASIGGKVPDLSLYYTETIN